METNMTEKAAMTIATENPANANTPITFPEQYLALLDALLREYPTFAKIISDDTTYQPVFLTPCEVSHRPVLGGYFFPDERSRIAGKFNRTAMAIVMAHAVLENSDAGYQFIVSQQPEEARLTRDAYNALADRFFCLRINAGMRSLLYLYIIIRGYARTPQARKRLERVTGKEYNPANQKKIIKHLIHSHLVPEAECMDLYHLEILRDAVKIDFSLSQFLNGESPVCLTEEELKEADPYAMARVFCLAANLFEMSGNAGHINQRGSLILNQFLASDFLRVSDLITRGHPIANFYKASAEALIASREFTFDEAIAGLRLSRLMSLHDSAAREIANFIVGNYPTYEGLARELGTGFPWAGHSERPVVLYYGWNYLTRVHRYYEMTKDATPIASTLKEVTAPLCGKIKDLRQKSFKKAAKSKILYLDMSDDFNQSNKRYMARKIAEKRL